MKHFVNTGISENYGHGKIFIYRVAFPKSEKQSIPQNEHRTCTLRSDLICKYNIYTLAKVQLLCILHIAQFKKMYWNIGCLM